MSESTVFPHKLQRRFLQWLRKKGLAATSATQHVHRVRFLLRDAKTVGDRAAIALATKTRPESQWANLRSSWKKFQEFYEEKFPEDPSQPPRLPQMAPTSSARVLMRDLPVDVAAAVKNLRKQLSTEGTRLLSYRILGSLKWKDVIYVPLQTAKAAGRTTTGIQRPTRLGSPLKVTILLTEDGEKALDRLAQWAWEGEAPPLDAPIVPLDGVRLSSVAQQVGGASGGIDDFDEDDEDIDDDTEVTDGRPVAATPRALQQPSSSPTQTADHSVGADIAALMKALGRGGDADPAPRDVDPLDAVAQLTSARSTTPKAPTQRLESRIKALIGIREVVDQMIQAATAHQVARINNEEEPQEPALGQQLQDAATSMLERLQAARESKLPVPVDDGLSDAERLTMQDGVTTRAGAPSPAEEEGKGKKKSWLPSFLTKLGE